MRKNYPILPPETESVLETFKLPLTPIGNGFGFYGTVAYDKETKLYTQCFICGKFYRGLGRHVNKTHNKDVHEYKYEYGLSIGTSLAAPAQKRVYREAQTLEVLLERAREARSHIKPESHSKNARQRKTLIQKNREGSCPEQLMDRLLRLKSKLGYAPSRSEYIREYGHSRIKTIIDTFGSWSEAKKIVEAQ